MLIKILSRKTNSFYQLANYINKEKSLEPMCVNFPQTGCPKKIARAFEENLKYKSKRVKNKLYNTVISFHEKDAISPKILEDITEEFIKQAGLDTHLVYGGFHTDQKHQHIHLMSSSNAYLSPQNFRLSKAQLKELQVRMERYQQAKYPSLRHSMIYTKQDRAVALGFKKVEKAKVKISDAEVHLKKRGVKPQKAYIIEQLKAIAQKSSSVEAFTQGLEADTTLTSYTYRGKLHGIVYQGKKYRFKTLLQTKDLQQIFRQLKYQTKEQDRTKDHENTQEL